MIQRHRPREGRMVYSFSRLKLYEQCPRRFRMKYIEGRQEPVTKPLALGKAVHKAVEKRLGGFSVHDAVTAGMIEAGFHQEVSRGEIED